MKEQLELLEALKERIEDGDIILNFTWKDNTVVKKEDLNPLRDILDHYNVQILYWLNGEIDKLVYKLKFEKDDKRRIY